MSCECPSHDLITIQANTDLTVQAAVAGHEGNPFAHPELKQVRQVVTSSGVVYDPADGPQLRTAIDTIVGCAVSAHGADVAAHPELPQVRRVITDAGLTYDPTNTGQLSQAISTLVEAVEPPDATETQKGVVRLANNAEAQAGALYTVAVHPVGLKATVDALINGAPASLNTLGELASAIGNDAGYATTVANQLALKAPLASPVLTGTPTAPTPVAGDNSGSLATTAFVKSSVETAVAGLINGAPGALDTLNELAAALGNNADFAASVANQLALKAPLASPALTGVPTAPTPIAGDSSNALATTAFVKGAVDGLNQTVIMPVGMECWYPGTVVPAGWLAEDGALVSRAEYPQLWAFVQTSGMMVSETTWQSGSANRAKFSSGDGSTTFRLPDLITDGLFIRAQSGADADFGRRQEDAFKAHNHMMGATHQEEYGLAPTGMRGLRPDVNQSQYSTTQVGGVETRPKNAGRLPIIKAH